MDKNKVLPCLIFLLGFTLVLCNPKDDSYSLVNDAYLNNLFPQNELQGLNVCLKYFDNIILKETQCVKIDQAYQKYFEQLSSFNSINEILNHLYVSDSDKDSLLIIIKTYGIFDDLFVYEYGLSRNFTDTLSVSLIPNLKGKYIDYLDYVSKINKELDSYRRIVQGVGTISPSLISGFYKSGNKLNFKDEKIRLLCALHFIIISSTVPKET